ncbi:MAG: NFACT RNA binding domain-containing protein, partial [Candidatus Heimdallarchaeota archaeon]
EIVKKYLEKDDLFLHAEIHGAAVVVIKGEGKEIPQQTIDEAAVFSVAYSRAWKDSSSSEDTFWVKPDQVSFSAPSGEYLAKGSFIIKGSKNILKNIPLEMAIAVVIEEKWAYAVGGPLSAIEKMDKIYDKKIIRVIPGEKSKSDTGKSIVNLFNKNLSDVDKSKVKATVLNDLITILPGNCYLKQD